jgi:hypothetical protein
MAARRGKPMSSNSSSPLMVRTRAVPSAQARAAAGVAKVRMRSGGAGRECREESAGNGPPGSRSGTVRDPSGRAWATSRGGCGNESYAVSDCNERPKPERSRSAAGAPPAARGACSTLGSALAAARAQGLRWAARSPLPPQERDATRPDQASARFHCRYHRIGPSLFESFVSESYPKGLWRRTRSTVRPPQSVTVWSGGGTLRSPAP